MRRPLAAAVALLALTAAAPTAALAHQGNPNMKSVVRALQPHVPASRCRCSAATTASS